MTVESMPFYPGLEDSGDEIPEYEIHEGFEPDLVQLEYPRQNISSKDLPTSLSPAAYSAPSWEVLHETRNQPRYSGPPFHIHQAYEYHAGSSGKMTTSFPGYIQNPGVPWNYVTGLPKGLEQSPRTQVNQSDYANNGLSGESDDKILARGPAIVSNARTRNPWEGIETPFSYSAGSPEVPSSYPMLRDTRLRSLDSSLGRQVRDFAGICDYPDDIRTQNVVNSGLSPVSEDLPQGGNSPPGDHPCQKVNIWFRGTARSSRPFVDLQAESSFTFS